MFTCIDMYTYGTTCVPGITVKSEEDFGSPRTGIIDGC